MVLIAILFHSTFGVGGMLPPILFHRTFGVGGMLPPILFLGGRGSHNPRIEFGRNQTLAFILDLRLVETRRLFGNP